MIHPIRKLGLAALLATLAACGAELTSEEHLAKAREFFEAAQYDSAIIELKNALQKDKGAAEARWLLGSLQLQRGEMDSAEKELRQASRLGWAADDVTPALARALLAQGKFVPIRELDTGRLSPVPQAEVYAIQALAEHAQGESEAAAELIARASSQAPDSVNVMLANARILASRGEMEQALQALDAVLAKEPKHGPALALKGDVLAYLEQPEQALAAYTAALELQPGNFNARLRRAMIKLQQGDYEAATADAELLMKSAPNHPGGNYIQGLIHFRNEAYADAITALTQAEPAYRQYPMVLFYLGSAHLFQGNKESATSYADRFVDLMPGNIAGRKLLATLRLQGGKYAEVAELMQPVLDNNPDDLDALNLMSNALIRDGKTEQGLSMLARLAELQPDSPQAQVRLGAGLLLSGDSEQGVHHIESALALDSEFQQADILLVLNHVRNKEFDRAIAAAQAYAGRNPASVTPHNLLGRVYLASGDNEGAKQAFAKALLIDDGDPGARHNLAQMALAAGDLDAAREHYGAILQHHDKFLPALIQLARLEARAGHEARVVEYLEQAISAHPRALEPRLMLGRYYLSRGEANRVQPLFGTVDEVQRNSPQVLQLLAVAQLSEKEHLQAQDTLEQLLEKTPETAGIHYMLARAAAGSGDNRQARAELERALELDPAHLPSRLALARLELLEGQEQAFADQLRQLVEQAPENIDVLSMQAAAAQRAGETETAIAVARHAFKLQPDGKTLLPLITYLEASGANAEAEKLIGAWLEDNPGDPTILLARAVNEGKQGRADSSLSGYREVLEQQPDNFVALNNLAWETRNEDPGQALDYARRAVQAAPNSAAALDTLAVVEFINGDARAAKRSIQKALELAPDIPSLRYHEAMIDNALGDTESARRVLEEILTVSPDFPEATEARALLQSLGG